MSEFTLNEAINSARQMANFFKAFKKIEEVVSMAAMLEQNIKELESRKEKLIPEIESLIEKKGLAEKSFSEVLEKTKEQFRDENSTLVSELKTARDKFDKEKEGLLLEIEAIKVAKMNGLIEHEEAMAQIKIEKEGAEKTLESIKEELKNIKLRFN
jgi:chromosome segregation ATPase